MLQYRTQQIAYGKQVDIRPTGIFSIITNSQKIPLGKPAPTASLNLLLLPVTSSPVPHLQKCSSQTKIVDTARRTSVTLVTRSPHRFKLTENAEKKKCEC